MIKNKKILALIILSFVVLGSLLLYFYDQLFFKADITTDSSGAIVADECEPVYVLMAYGPDNATSAIAYKNTTLTVTDITDPANPKPAFGANGSMELVAFDGQFSPFDTDGNGLSDRYYDSDFYWDPETDGDPSTTNDKLVTEKNCSVLDLYGNSHWEQCAYIMFRAVPKSGVGDVTIQAVANWDGICPGGDETSCDETTVQIVKYTNCSGSTYTQPHINKLVSDTNSNYQNSPIDFLAGETVYYQLHYTLDSASTVSPQTITITDDFDQNYLENISVNTASLGNGFQCSVDADKITCSTSTVLNPGDEGDIYYTAQVKAGITNQAITNTATITSENPAGIPESDSITVNVVPGRVKIIKEVSNIVPGQNFTWSDSIQATEGSGVYYRLRFYTESPTNTPASGITIDDSFADTLPLNYATTPATIVANTGNLNCITLGPKIHCDMPAGQTLPVGQANAYILTYSARVLTGTERANPYVNTATIASTNPVSSDSDNASMTVLNSYAALRINKKVSSDTTRDVYNATYVDEDGVYPGDTVYYRLTYEMEPAPGSVQTASGVTIVDNAPSSRLSNYLDPTSIQFFTPAGVTCYVASDVSLTIPGNGIKCDFANPLSQGDSGVIYYSAKVVNSFPDLPVAFQNTATISSLVPVSSYSDSALVHVFAPTQPNCTLAYNPLVIEPSRASAFMDWSVERTSNGNIDVNDDGDASNNIPLPTIGSSGTASGQLTNAITVPDWFRTTSTLYVNSLTSPSDPTEANCQGVVYRRPTCSLTAPGAVTTDNNGIPLATPYVEIAEGDALAMNWGVQYASGDQFNTVDNIGAGFLMNNTGTILPRPDISSYMTNGIVIQDEDVVSRTGTLTVTPASSTSVLYTLHVNGANVPENLNPDNTPESLYANCSLEVRFHPPITDPFCRDLSITADFANAATGGGANSYTVNWAADNENNARIDVVNQADGSLLQHFDFLQNDTPVQVTLTPDNDYRFELHLYDNNGQDYFNIDPNINNANCVASLVSPAYCTSFGANPTTVASGHSTELAWQTHNAAQGVLLANNTQVYPTPPDVLTEASLLANGDYYHIPTVNPTNYDLQLTGRTGSIPATTTCSTAVTISSDSDQPSCTLNFVDQSGAVITTPVSALDVAGIGLSWTTQHTSSATIVADNVDPDNASYPTVYAPNGTVPSAQLPNGSVVPDKSTNDFNQLDEYTYNMTVQDGFDTAVCSATLQVTPACTLQYAAFGSITPIATPMITGDRATLLWDIIGQADSGQITAGDALLSHTNTTYTQDGSDSTLALTDLNNIFSLRVVNSCGTGTCSVGIPTVGDGLQLNKGVGTQTGTYDYDTYYVDAANNHVVATNSGDTIYYNLRYRALSSSGATLHNIQIVDDYDENAISIVASSLPAACTDNGSVITCNIGDLVGANSNTATWHDLAYSALVLNYNSADNIFSNTATIDSDDTSPTQDSAFVYIEPSTEVSILKVARDTVLGNEDDVYYDITVTNTTGVAQDFVIRDTLSNADTENWLQGDNGGYVQWNSGSVAGESPHHAEFTASAGSTIEGSIYDASGVIIRNFQPNGSVVLSYHMRASNTTIPTNQDSTVTNTAILYTYASNQVGTEVGRSTETVLINGPRGGGGGGGGGGGSSRRYGSIALTIEKQAKDADGNWQNADTLAEAVEINTTEKQTVNYRVILKNTGGFAANDIIVADKFTGDFKQSNIRNVKGATWDETAQEFTVKTVSGSGTSVFTFDADVDTAVGTNSVNTTTIEDYVFANAGSSLYTLSSSTGKGMSDDAHLAVVPPEEIIPKATFSKVANYREASAGQEITYTIVARNTNDFDLTNVQVVDTYPIDLIEVTDHPRGKLEGDKITWKKLILRPGENWVIHYKAKIRAGVTGGTVIRNIAELTVSEDLPPMTDDAKVVVTALPQVPQTGLPIGMIGFTVLVVTYIGYRQRKKILALIKK